MRRFVSHLLFFLSMIFSISMYAQDTLNAQRLGIYPSKKIIIDKDIDLKGGILSLPVGVILNFKGGVIKNGTIIGNNTRINCRKYAFDQITIKGTWNVPTIYSIWFKNLSYENALKNVIALTNPYIKNKVIIAEGEYWVSVTKEEQSCLKINSNTEICLNGTIRLKSNPYRFYNIFYVEGHNIFIRGKGTIIGDKHAHIGTLGEWGMGIKISHSDYVKVSGLSIKSCWGDCIYIGDDSKNIIVEKCILDHGRRQGISVTSGDNIVLRKLIITNVSGTAPEYAIDIEPNPNCIIGSILIDKVITNKCKGGIKVWGEAKGTLVENVTISKCKIYNTENFPISIRKCDTIEVTDCLINTFMTRLCIYIKNVRKGIVKRNKLRNDDNMSFDTKNRILEDNYIYVDDNCEQSLIKDNQFIH